MNKTEAQMCANIDRKNGKIVSNVKARTFPPIEKAIEASVLCISADHDFDSRKRKIAQLYRVFKTPTILTILFRLAEMGIEIPSIDEK
jgi:hypothetical protein